MDGPSIRLLRDRIRYTQGRLATLIGVHVLTVSRWERGALTPTPEGVRLLHAVERALEVAPDLPDRLRRIGSDPVRELTVVLSALHPDLAAEAVLSREDAAMWLDRASRLSVKTPT